MQGSEYDDKTADPDPHHQRTHQYFQCRLVFVQLAEAGEDQIYIVADRALVHGAPDRRLLGRKKFERGVETPRRRHR